MMQKHTVRATSRRRLGFWAAAAASGVAALALCSPRSAAAQPYDCNSPNPAMWPPPAKPYFMLLVDTSGSMVGCTNPSTSNYQFPNSCPSTAPQNSCGMEPTRINDAKCALRQTVQAFAGEVNFGLATFPVNLAGCGNGACVDTCTAASGSCTLSGGVGTSGEYHAGNGCSVTGYTNTSDGASCGNFPSCGPAGPAAPNLAKGTWRNGGKIVVDMLRDTTPPGASNVATLLEWFDGNCNNSRELFAIGGTPIGGSLRTIHQYFLAGWNSGWHTTNYCASGLSYTSPTPMDPADPQCRNLNVILVTDGDPSCGDTVASSVSAAQALFQQGVTFGGKNFPVRTHVINFAGGVQSTTDQIAAAGGTVASLSANNEVTLAQALSTIIASAVKPETCNNADDNCNGCIDEGYARYCNVKPAGQCCAWGNPTQRNTCLTNYQNSITPSNPQGNVALLPCTTVAQSQNPATWLCFNPGELCDDADNNCNGQTDETFNKCGNPLKCPGPELCNGEDDDCDGIIDNAAGSGVPYSACPNNCQPSAEICDGCDNNCNGIADDGVADIPCGFSPPGNCAGVRTCVSKGVAVPVGGCVGPTAPKGFGACSNTPQPEICDGLDNNCNGTVDEGIAPGACEIPGQPGLKYQEDGFPLSQCKKGILPCNGTCSGWTGPSAEICDGIDNDCDGIVDNNIPGLGQECGLATGQCSKGQTACVGGVIVCQGGTQPQPEICDGLDNDCDGTTDNAPMVDQPSNPGCWSLPATGCSPTCSHQNVSWCPPAGGTCTGTGTLSTPCQTGTLVCDGANQWKCQGGVVPTAEVCDGVDNNCNSQVDESLGAPVGQSCGSSVGECSPGVNVCVSGVIQCQGGQGPTPEVCDGLDNDCDGDIDNGIPLGGACTPVYDTNLYPGDRTKGVCKPGVLACDGQGGTVCVGGVGPSAEICDGVDNDCDGQVDEPGPAPDGINGTEDPLQPGVKIGDACGTSVGECKPGQYACAGGKFVCLGGVGPNPEVCDCLDNDCDGQVDNEPAAGSLCSTGKTCVAVAGGNCQCAEPCAGGEFPCPTSFECKNVTKSGTGQALGDYCVNDGCGDCTTKTVKDQQTGVTLCGPEGTAGSKPECVCKANKCQHPCANIQCPTGQECALQGSSAGTCQPTGNCFFFGCDAGEVCNGGVCVADPCTPNPCQADEVCKPNATFSEPRCVGSCASVTCPTGQQCVEGQCEETGCAQGCAPGEVCQPTGDGGYACGPNQCATDAGQPCSNGAWCNPATGACGNEPCEGVVCPVAQLCAEGQCIWAPEGGAGTGGSGTGGSGTGGSGTGGAGPDAGLGGGSGGNISVPTTDPERGVWGLATGGGGCACRAAGTDRRTPLGAALAFGALAVALGLRRRRRGPSRDETVDGMTEGDAR
ncbi:MAG: hypothetical protein KF718_27975 [Polyangiaceae bacterium]|nr:hypothetical protein [Polyangiaceae bacterium]